MSLQVWLPLTKDLRNQGLSNIKVENHNATLNTAGKLGSCYYFNGNQQWLQFDTVLGDYYNNDWSIACWLKPTDSTRSVIISEYSSTGASNVGLELTTSRVVRLYWNGSPDINFTTAGALPINEWTHLTVTKQARIVKVYFNGELKQTYTNSSDFSTRTSASYPRIGDDYRGNSANTVSYQGYINDFRMYDHCLSPMEVKKLSQGLILHYPLNRQGWGQENLVWNTHYDSMPSHWNNWGSPPTREIVEINGKRWLHVKASDRWQGYSQNQNNRNGVGEITAGEQLVLSYWAYGAAAYNSYPCIGIHWYDSSSNILAQVWPQFNITTTPQKCVATVTVPSGVSAFNIMVGNGSGTSGNTNEVWISEVKLEEGSIATPWCPNSSDTLATTMGLNSTTEYDCSGFCNNGEKIGTLTYTSDTPKYAVSTHLDATTTKIHISNFPTSGFGNSYTFAWWAKISSINPMHWGFSDGIRLNGMYTGRLWNTGDGSNNPLYNIGTTTQVTAPTVNVWHHWVMTGNGTKCYVYQDGELWAEAKTYKSISGTSIYINGWANSTDYSSNNYSISDFRIYATALSADDVKSLYQNCATIDPDGTIRGQIRN